MKIKKDEIIEKSLIDEESLSLKIKQLAKTLNEHYADKDELILICILKGSVMFMAELAKHLNIETKMEFMSSYTAACTAERKCRTDNNRISNHFICKLKSSIEICYIL